MYAAAGKLSRGGGSAGRGGNNRRSSTPLASFHHQAPPLHNRPSSARNRPATASAPEVTGTEETMSLVRGKPLEFGMIVRLTPDLVDEIKRAEAEPGGGGVRIKFDSNANNTSGNVIDVGGKNFRFTWAREVGDLCDIYEERQSGEDGDGLLVESGCAWRKLNIQRVLDESTTNHVKKRSEEAERQQKSRKAIVLDHKSSAMKNQVKALAASESTNTWRKPFQQKKEPEFKKRKIDPPPVAIAGPAKYKSGLPSSTTVTGRPSISPSPPQRSGAPASPFVTGVKGHMSAEDLSNQARENAILSEKGKFSKPSSRVVQEKPERKGNFVDKSMDLQSMLTTLLKENPKGLSLKALEKAVGDSVPNSNKKIEPIIKKIATYQAPGKYILKKPLSESGSSPDDNGQQTPVVEQKHEDTSTPPNFAQKAYPMELDKQAFLNLNIGQETNSFDNVDIQGNSPDLFGEKKITDNSEGPARSSSNSGSDSDSESDSSDSGRSKSKSPVKSGSVSSSDSDSDASSNSSKQGPDEDVDIISDDEESKPNTQMSEPKFATSPIPYRDFDAGPTQTGLDEKQDNGYDIVEIEQNDPDDDVHQTVADPDRRDAHDGYMFSERENIADDVSKRDLGRIPESTSKSKSKSKRGSDSKPPHEKSRHSKRSKHENLSQPQVSRPRDPISESPQIMSADNRVVEEPSKGHSLKNTSADSEFRKGDNQGINGKLNMNNQNSGRKNNQSQERLSLQTDDNRSNKEKVRNSKETPVVEKTPVAIGSRGKKLQRELSELELGEFREPLPEEIARGKALERKSSFKETENRPSSSDYWNNSDLGKGRPTFRPGGLSNVEGPPKRTPENQTVDIARAPNRVLPAQAKGSLNPSRTDLASRKSVDTGGKIRHNEARENQENGDHMNVSVSISKQKDKDVERGSVSHSKRESKTQKINSFPDPGEVKKDASLTESSEGAVKRRESSSDENSCSFSKYEKDEPELKGPVKDLSQYYEYVQEYQEKFDSYCSLNKTLESYRIEFYKLGEDLESAKGRDMEKYHQILGKLQESYRLCGSRHKRLKKIFIVLHEELKHLKQVIKDYAESYGRE